MTRRALRYFAVARAAALLVLFAVSAGAAPVPRSGSSVSGSGVAETTVVGTEPVGCTNGDFIVAQITRNGASSLTPPAGWTELYNSVEGSLRWSVAYIVRGGSAPSYTWTHNSISDWREAKILCVRPNAGGTLSLDSQSAAGTSTGAGTNPDPPSTTAVASSTLAVTGGATSPGSGGSGWTDPSGYSFTGSMNTAGDEGLLWHRTLSASGAENPGAWSGGGGSGELWNGFTITIVETGGGGGGATCRGSLSSLGVGGC